jgi:protein deglycase
MKKVLLLLANGFEILEASVFIDVIGWNLTEGDGTTRLFSCGLKKEVSSSFHQRFIVDYLIDEVDISSFDALAIPGGFEEFGYYKDAYDEKFLDVIRRFNKQDKVIASVCVGALPIGKSGALSGRRGTTYFLNDTRKNTLREFGVQVMPDPIVEDHNIITSWNPSTAVDVALTLLERLTSRENADHIRHLMGFSD